MFWKTVEGRFEFGSVCPLFILKPTSRPRLQKLAALAAEAVLYKLYGSLLCQEKTVQLMALGHKVTQTQKVNYRSWSLEIIIKKTRLEPEKDGNKIERPLQNFSSTLLTV